MMLQPYWYPNLSNNVFLFPYSYGSRCAVVNTSSYSASLPPPKKTLRLPLFATVPETCAVMAFTEEEDPRPTYCWLPKPQPFKNSISFARNSTQFSASVGSNFVLKELNAARSQLNSSQVLQITPLILPYRNNPLYPLSKITTVPHHQTTIDLARQVNKITNTRDPASPASPGYTLSGKRYSPTKYFIRDCERRGPDPR